jgi:cyanophycinase-like exopeptidase
MPGRVYLVASGQNGLLGQVAQRAVHDIGQKGLRIAVSYAPVAGDAQGMKFMSERMAGLFPGATLEVIEHDRAVVDRAGLVFVSGGDPAHGAKVLAETGAAAWLREAHARGTPMMGVSAGAITLGAWWIDWPEDEDAPEEQADLVPCVGVVPGYVFDTHDEADGWEELHVASRLLARRGEKARFVGIPTKGALVFDDRGAMEVVGESPFTLG